MIELNFDNGVAPLNILSTGDIERIQDVVNEALGERFSGTINIAFVTDDEIRRLNRIYRKKDSITDVLSFPYEDEMAGVEMGDVVISYDQAVRQAEEGDIELEIKDLIIHGILHVLGYDHEEPTDADIMFPLQDKLVQKIL